MTDSEAAVKRYYYAGGKKLGLDPDDDWVVVDTLAAGDDVNARLQAAQVEPSRLPGNLLMTSRAALAADDLGSLESAGALRPVFRRDQALMVPLPEVRVEFDSEQERAQVKSFVAGLKGAVSVTEDASDRLVLAPTSGNALDALELANEIYEHARPAASSVRFLQMTPSPRIKR